MMTSNFQGMMNLLSLSQDGSRPLPLPPKCARLSCSSTSNSSSSSEIYSSSSLSLGFQIPKLADAAIDTPVVQNRGSKFRQEHKATQEGGLSTYNETESGTGTPSPFYHQEAMEVADQDPYDEDRAGEEDHNFQDWSKDTKCVEHGKDNFALQIPDLTQRNVGPRTTRRTSRPHLLHPEEKLRFLGEDAPRWLPILPNWAIFGMHPSFSAKNRTMNKDRNFRTMTVKNVQIKLDVKNFRYVYRTVPFLKRLQSTLTNTQLAANFYNSTHLYQAGMQDPSFAINQSGRDNRTVCFSFCEYSPISTKHWKGVARNRDISASLHFHRSSL